MPIDNDELMLRRVMKMKINFLSQTYFIAILFILSVFSFAIVAQVKESVTLDPRAYQDDITEEDMRIKDMVASIKNTKEQLGEKQFDPDDFHGLPTIKLRYAGDRLDYLVFYDLDGREALYRYREDRFDDRGDKIRNSLIKGQAYLVAGRFYALYHGGRAVSPDNADFLKYCDTNEAVPVFYFGSVYPLRLDQILLK